MKKLEEVLNEKEEVELQLYLEIDKQSQEVFQVKKQEIHLKEEINSLRAQLKVLQLQSEKQEIEQEF